MYTSYRPLKIVIVGGVAAGMSAAMRARRNDARCSISVIQKEDDVSFAACGLPYWIGGDVPSDDKLVIRTKKDFEQAGIRVLTAHEALSFNAIRKTIRLKELSTHKVFNLPYDRLIIATGARPQTIAAPGADLNGIFYLRSLRDGRAIDAYIREYKPKKAHIIGSGYIGLEMAEALRKRGLRVTVVEKADTLLPMAAEPIREAVMTTLLQNECRFMVRNTVLQFVGASRVTSLMLQNGGEEETDLVILATGVTPNVAFARSGGVGLGRTGAIAVNARQETNVQGVFAAGDCSEARHRIANRYTWLPLGTTANKQGQVAADNATGRPGRFEGITGTIAVKVFDYEYAATGLSLAELDKWAPGYETACITAGSRAGYYPGGAPLTVWLAFEKRSGKVLTVQMGGRDGVVKRIDVAAVALQAKMTVHDLAGADLSYAPPFAPVKDPLLLAARQAVKILETNKRR